MITFASKGSVPAPAGLSSILRAVVVATGAALLLAGCGKGHEHTSTVAKTHARPAATHAAASTTSAAATLPAQLPASAASNGNQAGQAAQANAEKQAEADKAKLDSMSIPALLTAAREAYAQHRVVAPAGDNAMEYYEAVLARDPNNQVARDALRETFPFGVPVVEKAIAQNDFAEANREIALLTKADPTNYTLTLLRSKLDAQKKLLARQQQQQQQEEQQAAALAAAKAAAEAKAAQQAEAEKAAAAAAAAAAAKAAAARQAPPKPVAPPPPPKPVGITRGVELVKKAQADYPIQAARNQISGYATVEFTVTAEGEVTKVHVIDSSPRHVFDRAAMEAIKRSTFKPAMKDGKPVSTVLQRRVAFQLGG